MKESSKISHSYSILLDLNQLTVRAPRHRINIETATESQFKVRIEEDLSDSVLAVGDRYQMDDVKCGAAASLGEHSSGVLRNLDHDESLINV